MNNVLITGIGAVSALGIGIEELILQFSQQPLIPKDIGFGGYGYPIENKSHEAYVPKKLLRKMDRFSKFHASAVALALSHAKLTEAEHLDKNQIGLMFETGFGSAATVTLIMNDLLGPDPLVSPLLFPNVVANAGSAQACISFGLRGQSTTIGGLGALMYAFDMIRTGKAERLVVGGAEEIIPLFTRSLMEHGVINAQIPIGEGAVAFVLESERAATERGAVPLARIGAVSMATDPDFKPLGEHAFNGGGLKRTVHEALNGKIPSLVIGCNNGSERLEQREKEALGEDILSVASYICPKKWTGEVFGMGSALGVAIGAMHLYAQQTKMESYLEAASASNSSPLSTDHSEGIVLANAYDATRGQAMSTVLLPV